MSTPPLNVQQHAWHDATCPEGEECRSREMHALGEPIPQSGILARYHEALDKILDSTAPPGRGPARPTHPATMIGRTVYTQERP